MKSTHMTNRIALSSAPAGLFYELLSTTRLPFYLTLLNNLNAIVSLSIVYKDRMLLSVKPRFKLLNNLASATLVRPMKRHNYRMNLPCCPFNILTF